jgi:hypothetical protein
MRRGPFLYEGDALCGHWVHPLLAWPQQGRITEMIFVIAILALVAAGVIIALLVHR